MEGELGFLDPPQITFICSLIAFTYPPDHMRLVNYSYLIPTDRICNESDEPKKYL